MQLIRRDAEHGARIVEDEWAPSDILSLEQLHARGAAGAALKIDGSADPEQLAPHLDYLRLVVIEVPKFTDGRAYSLARVLRDQHGYQGELRAVGHVLREQLFYLFRCGFDSFVLAEGRDLEDALSAFEDFSVTYQPAVDHQQPIWRRRSP